MQKEMYENPEMELVLVDREEIITSSTGDAGDNKIPWSQENL